MITANHGTVVTIASVAACVSAPSLVDYSSSKSAALSFHEGLAAELKTLYEAPKVRTICVCPSWIETNMAKQVKLTDKFVVPMLKVETVAEKVVEKITSGNSGVVVVSCNFLLSVILFGWSTDYPAMESRGADHGFVLSDFRRSLCLCHIYPISNAQVALQIPEAANWVAWSARALPMWWQVFLRTESGKPVKGLRSLKEVKEAMEAGVNLKSE